MDRRPAKIVLNGLLLVALYVSLFFLSGLLLANQSHRGIISLLFLPAFVRLLGFLLIDFWSVPALLVANLTVVALGGFDLGPGNFAEMLISVLTAIGGPVGAAAVCLACRVHPELEGLNGRQLLLLSLGCAAGNAVALSAGHAIVGTPGVDPSLPLSIIFGDTLGTWTVIYAIKLILTYAGRAFRFPR